MSLGPCGKAQYQSSLSPPLSSLFQSFPHLPPLNLLLSLSYSSHYCNLGRSPLLDSYSSHGYARWWQQWQLVTLVVATATLTTCKSGDGQTCWGRCKYALMWLWLMEWGAFVRAGLGCRLIGRGGWSVVGVGEVLARIRQFGEMEVASIVLLTLFVVFPVYGEEDLHSFTLVLTWPNGFCRVNPNCYRPVPQDFTLHGWETLLLLLASIGQVLMQSLGSKTRGKQIFIFLKYQWNKHGTCSNLDPLIYFRTALHLKNEINLLNALRLSHITPGQNFYTPLKIVSAIKKQTGYRPVVKCTKLSGRGMVLEIHLCVDLPTPQFPIYRLVSCTNQRSIDCHGDGTNIYFSAQNRYQALVTWT
ncbi:hypothetical protein Acr_27g0009430 [Actinidia rufa]|uniref:Uncharacterized protein n=1 Tax=Actinidia rufa TaxID=165716 RepID=A0A7J0H8U5_9ERIC|nr:hypothetical protein Acr_27g0009430 [Actinidia rufa]